LFLVGLDIFRSAYVGHRDFQINPRHPPLVKLRSEAVIAATGFQVKPLRQFSDKPDERMLTQSLIFQVNDPDSARVLYFLADTRREALGAGRCCRRLESLAKFARPCYGRNFMTAGKIVREPRWPAFVAMIAASGVYWALPEPLSVGPSWGLLVIIIILMIPIVVSHRRRDYGITRILTFAANGVITIAMIASLGFLIDGIPKHREPPQTLLRSAAALWIANVLVFALWYWKLDAGGPMGRDGSRGRIDSSFLFPQMLTTDPKNQDNKKDPLRVDSQWSPHFMDYLFLAFNTSTAFSPTDTAVLSRWAKIGMMLQALISLAIIALIAARAVNIL
jgi:hypothetical protein